MSESRSDGMAPGARAVLWPLLAALAASVSLAGDAATQAATPAEPSVAASEVADTGGAGSGGAAEEHVAAKQEDVPAHLLERWEAPFAVVQLGRIAPREPRRVFLPDPSAGGPMTVAEGLEGGSAAEVATLPAAQVGARPVAGDEGEESSTGLTTAATASGAVVAPEEPAAEAGEDEPDPGSGPDDDGEPAASPRQGAGERTHRVAYGETWYGLARRFGVTPASLAAANPAVDPERLRAGSVLRVPTVPAARTHTVVGGDTLYGIARRYGISAEAIRSANELPGDVVRLGQTLLIPREEASR